MECVNCEALLDDLRRGDLPARLEAEARSHLAACPRCRAVHMQLLRIDAESAPPQPPQSSRTRASLGLLNLLRPRPKTVRSRADTRSVTLYGALVGLLGRLAMAPQVAMGTVMLLIVLVGLWSLPQLTRRHNSRYRSSADSVRVHRPGAETDTSAALSEAAQLSSGNERRLESSASQTSGAAGADRYPESARMRSGGGLRGPPPRAREPQPTTAASSERKQPSAQLQQGRRELDSAMQHYRAREYPAASALLARALESLAASDQPQALLYLARAERMQGHCERALGSYESLVRGHAARIEARAALREAVACHDRLRQPGRAQQLLEQAKTSPPLASTAQNMLSQRAPSAPNHSGLDAQL